MQFKKTYLALLIAIIAIKESFQVVKIGANVEGIADWSRSHAFVDLVKQSRAFGSADQPWVTNDTLPVLDPNGWPTGDFGVILWIDEATNMTGTYKLSLECGTIPTIRFVASSGQILNIQYNNVSKVLTADVVIPSGSTQTLLSFKNTVTGVRNLKLIRPYYDPANPPVFTTPFLQHFSHFDTLRFMDWGATNGNPISTWSQRNPPIWPTMAGIKGVALEYQILLANTLNKNMWINIPHKADNDYVTNAATLIKNTINPGLNVYVEYSNELWNWGFSQTQYNLQIAINEVANNPSSNLNYDNSNNNGFFLWRYNARRAKEIIEIFRNVFGTDSKRIKGVFAVQVSYPDGMLANGLNYINAVYGDPKQYFSYIAGAPYFNLGGNDVANNLTQTNILDYLDQSVEQYRTDLSLLKNRYIGAFYGIPVIAYEGGPDTFGPYNVQAKKMASFDPRIQDICTKYLDIWFSYGFGLFNWFIGGADNWNTQYGTWGLTDVMGKDSPKLRAVINYINNGVENVTVGTLLPAVIDGRQFIGPNYYNWQSIATTVVYTNGIVDYLVRSNQATRYYLVLSVSTTSTTKIKVELNNTLLTTFNLSSTNNIFISQSYITTDLNIGFSGIRLNCLSGSFKISQLSVTSCMPAPVITSSLNQLATQGVPFTYSIIATNNANRFDASNLPPGLTIDATLGVIQGSPAVSGNISVTLYAFNDNAQSNAQLNLNILPELLLKDSFEYPLGILGNNSGGVGFNGPWIIQNNNPTFYVVKSDLPLTYPSLLTYGNYANGGGWYLSIGRAIDVSNRFMLFNDNTNVGNIGADNRVLWLSALFRREANGDDDSIILLHPMSSTVWGNGATRIGMGYFGGTAVSGIRYWSLKYADNTPVRSNKSLSLNETSLLVMKIEFNSGANTDNVYLYVNPSLTIQPTVHDAQINGITVSFKSMLLYLGNNPNFSSIDEIHMGVSYRSVIEQ